MESGTKKILVVDDEQDLREAVATSLRQEGFEVLTATDGKEGLEKAFNEHPDLIFLDIIMPNMDGLEVLRHLREDEWGDTVPVIMMTVVESVESMAEFVELGGSEYILKTDVNLGDVVLKAKHKLGVQ